jgi:hypothetical protein
LKFTKAYITDKHYEDPFSVALKVAQHYHQVASEMMEAVKNKTKTQNKNFAAWSGPYKAKKTTVRMPSIPGQPIRIIMSGMKVTCCAKLE